MHTMAWIILVAISAVLAFGGWLLRKRWVERNREAEAREARFIAQRRPARPAAAPAAPAPARATAPPRHPDASSLPQQKLLFEAAAKAAQAGEPALSIQLYARLLSRYPESGFATEVRAAVEAQKKKLAKA
jgi:hypothetical protein